MRLVAIQRWLIAMSELETLAQAASAEIRDTLSLDALDAIRVRLLGKSGVITDQLKALGKLAPEERKAQGEQVNRVKQLLTDLIADRKDTLENAALDERLGAERIDVSLPGRNAERGSVHPLTRALDRITTIFARLGYQVADGWVIRSPTVPRSRTTGTTSRR